MQDTINDVEVTLSERKLWSIKTVSKTIEAAEPTIWEWCRKGKFPKPRKKGKRFTRWYSDAVLDWMNSLPEAD